MSVLYIYAVYVFENFNHPPKNHLKFPLGVKKIEDFFVFFYNYLLLSCYKIGEYHSFASKTHLFLEV